GRVEDRRLVTGRGVYVGNLRLPDLAGAAYVTVVRSPIAHARIRSVDAEAARGAPGVLGVFTAADVALPPAKAAAGPEAMAQPCLAAGTVRYVGEPVAVVVAEDPARGADAAALVEVDYEPLPAVVTVENALAGEVLLFPEAGSNGEYEHGEP